MAVDPAGPGTAADEIAGQGPCRPIARSAVLADRVVVDLLTQVVGLVVLAATGLAVGWGIHNGVGDASEAFGLCLFIAFAMTWVGAGAGMVLENADAAQALGSVFFLPLSFVSNVFVPTQGMPPWPRTVADWNPVSAVASSCRGLIAGDCRCCPGVTGPVRN